MHEALVTFGIYSAVVFLLAWFSNRLLAKKKFLNEYYLGSRGLGVMALTLSYGATSASAGSFVGFPSLVYSHGWVVGLWIAGYMVVPLVGMALIGKRINHVARRAGAITVPDLLRERFESRALGLLATGLIVFLLSFYLVPQFKTAGIILDRLLQPVPAYGDLKDVVAAAFPTVKNVGYLVCLGLFAILVIAYTTFGGFRAVVWTDVLQGFVMVFGVVFMLVMALWMVGGLRRSTEKLALMTPPRLGAVVFERSEADGEPVAVPALSWVTLEEDGRSMLVRTSVEGIVPAGETASAPVKAVQITTPEEIADIVSGEGFVDGRALPLPGGLSVRLHGEMKEYGFGAGQRGVYVRGPGPHAASTFGFMPVGLAISFFFLWPLGGAGQPGNMVRLMAFDTSRTFRRSLVLLSVYFGLIYFPLVIIFCTARVILPGMEGEASDRIMPEMAFRLADAANVPWLAGLLVAAPFAAAMSTVDSFMLMISSSVVRDVYQRNINPAASEKRVKRLGFGVTLVVGLVIALGAVNPPTFLQYLIVFASSGLTAAFLVPVCLGLYWPRFNSPGAIASMAGGFAVFLSLYVVGFVVTGEKRPLTPLGLDPLLWGTAASLAVGIVVSLFTAPPPARLRMTYFN